jgi:hypothetical protein
VPLLQSISFWVQKVKSIQVEGFREIESFVMNSDRVMPIKAKSRSGLTEVELRWAKDSCRIQSSRLLQDQELFKDKG